MTPAVSVLMSVYNPHPVHFREAVASVLGQTFGDLELVIVEDPSEASAADRLAGLTDPRLRLIRNDRRNGLIAQRNRTLAEARADRVSLIDADDMMEPDRLAKQMAYLDEHPEVAVLGCQLTVIGQSGEVLGVRDYPTSHAAIAAAMPLYNAIPQPGVLARKGAILAAGGYRFEFPVEDYELWSRMLVGGSVFANHPEPLLRYRVGGATKGDKLRTTIRLTREVKRMYWRCGMTPRGRLRYWAEGVLLYLPPAFVYQLFKRTQFRPAPAAAPTTAASSRG